MFNRKSTLYGLKFELGRRGILQRAIKHFTSADYVRLVLYYYDRNLDETFMCIFRSSRLCFYISVDDEKKTFRTLSQIVDYLDDFFTAQGEWVDYVHYIKSSRMLENRFYHSRYEVRERDFEEWKARRLKEINGV